MFGSVGLQVLQQNHVLNRTKLGTRNLEPGTVVLFYYCLGGGVGRFFNNSGYT